jgi:hypothetical protein
MRGLVAVILLSIALVAAAGGCAAEKSTRQFRTIGVPAGWRDGLLPPRAVPEVQAMCDPPRDWAPQPLERTGSHAQQVWLSPTGRTAYGVICFALPLPLGSNLALSGFLREMKRQEGQATLLSRSPGPDGLSFVAEGGKYRVRGTIVTRGRRGWVVYAGTLRHGPVALDELELAVQARDNTAPGLPDPPPPAP